MILTTKQLFPTLLIFVTSALAWVLAPEPIPFESGAVVGESWSIPQIQRRDSPKWSTALARHSLWGEDSGGLVNGEAAATNSEWSFMGVVIEGSDAFALIGVGGQPSKPYRVGDLTPDGGKIVRIDEDRLYLLSQGAERVLEVYRK